MKLWNKKAKAEIKNVSTLFYLSQTFIFVK